MDETREQVILAARKAYDAKKVAEAEAARVDFFEACFERIDRMKADIAELEKQMLNYDPSKHYNRR
jgi:hypothetical protein